MSIPSTDKGVDSGPMSRSGRDWFGRTTHREGGELTFRVPWSRTSTTTGSRIPGPCIIRELYNSKELTYFLTHSKASTNSMFRLWRFREVYPETHVKSDEMSTSYRFTTPKKNTV